MQARNLHFFISFSLWSSLFSNLSRWIWLQIACSIPNQCWRIWKSDSTSVQDKDYFVPKWSDLDLCVPTKTEVKEDRDEAMITRKMKLNQHTSFIYSVRSPSVWFSKYCFWSICMALLYLLLPHWLCQSLLSRWLLIFFFLSMSSSPFPWLLHSSLWWCLRCRMWHR